MRPHLTTRACPRCTRNLYTDGTHDSCGCGWRAETGRYFSPELLTLFRAHATREREQQHRDGTAGSIRAYDASYIDIAVQLMADEFRRTGAVVGVDLSAATWRAGLRFDADTALTETTRTPNGVAVAPDQPLAA